jgi:hypothetical protein
MLVPGEILPFWPKNTGFYLVLLTISNVILSSLTATRAFISADPTKIVEKDMQVI